MASGDLAECVSAGGRQTLNLQKIGGGGGGRAKKML